MFGAASVTLSGRLSDAVAVVAALRAVHRGRTDERSYCSGIVRFMPRGNPSPKLAITVDPDVHAQVVAAAAAEGVSVSAWMTAAARRALRLREGLAAVAEWEAEHGALTSEELEAARRRVGAANAERRSA